MRSALTTCLLLLFTCVHQLPAQSVWKHFSRPDIGAVLYGYNYQETRSNKWENSHSDISLPHVGMIVGFNLPFVPLADNLSLGLNPSVAIAFANRSDFYGASETVMGSLEVPWYATIKYGTDATYKGTQFPLGVSLGIGYQYSYAFAFSGGFSEGFGLPSVMAEVNFGKRKTWPGLVKLRYTTTLGSAEFDYSTSSTEHKLSIKHSGFHLIVVPGY